MFSFNNYSNYKKHNSAYDELQLQFQTFNKIIVSLGMNFENQKF